jgi:3-oxoadipate enol-lactonase
MHGAEADHSMFEALAERLATSFTVIAYDQRDCGATDNPAETYGLGDLADDAAALLDALGIARAHVYGTSFGGILAQLLAARHPARIDRLVLASTWRTGRSPLEVNPDAVRTLVALRADPIANAAKIAEYFFPADYLRANPQAIELFRRTARDDPRRVRRQAVTLSVESADLSAFVRPVLLLAGAEDRLIPRRATFALRDHVARATTLALPGVAHAGTIHAPQAIADAVAKFLVH